jgi:hypothetical protein
MLLENIRLLFSVILKKSQMTKFVSNFSQWYSQGRHIGIFDGWHNRVEVSSHVNNSLPATEASSEPYEFSPHRNTLTNVVLALTRGFLP